MNFEYRTVELPMRLAGSGKGSGEAAKALQEVIDQNAVNGWEFYRVDTFNVTRPLGCLSGGKVEIVGYNVVTFRRTAGG